MALGYGALRCSGSESSHATTLFFFPQIIGLLERFLPLPPHFTAYIYIYIYILCDKVKYSLFTLVK